MNKDAKQQYEPPSADPQVIEFLSKNSVRLVGPDVEHPHLITWERVPIDQGDKTHYQFSTPKGIKHDGWFIVTLIDGLYDAGFRAGQAALRSEIKQLLG